MKYILGSGLVALLCRKILGEDWQIIPIGPSRFYSSGVPAFADDFVVYNDQVKELIKDWPLNQNILFYKRPFSYSGQLLYNDVFVGDYLNKLGIDNNLLTKTLLQTNFTVFGFSNLQLWNYLVKLYISEIRSFLSNNYEKILSIGNHKIVIKLKNEGHKVIEYDQIISTVPFNSLCEMFGVHCSVQFQHTYQYYLKDSVINLEKADQVLLCDADIPFHKCTRVKNGYYLFETVGQYIEDHYNLFRLMLGDSFEIESANIVNNGYANNKIDDNDKILIDNNIICIGSLAQCDYFMDISSCINRIGNLINKDKISN